MSKTAKTPFLTKLRRNIHRFRKNEEGVALVEFAIVIPILVLVLVPTSFETTKALLVKRKAAQTATSIADLATQVTVFDEDIFDTSAELMKRIVEPYDKYPLRLRVIGVSIDANKRVKQEWSHGDSTVPLDPNSLPAGLVTKNSFYVMSASELDYQVEIAGATIDLTFRDTATMAPRLSSSVAGE